jgi:hypothetical protein
MTNLDQFESTFKSADKARFSYESVSLQELLVVTDGDEEMASGFRSNVEQMLIGATGIESLELSVVMGADPIWFAHIAICMWKPRIIRIVWVATWMF